MNFLLIDDHQLFQLGFEMLCQDLDGVSLECCGSISQAKSKLVANSPYDLILIDLGLPDGNGLTLLEFCQTHCPLTPQVILSANLDAVVIKTALQMGARGYIGKSSNTTTITKAIELVLSGETYIPKEMMLTMAGSELKLTPKQLQILKHLSKGDNNKTIADKVYLSAGTVRNYVSDIFQILAVSNRQQAVLVAKNKGLL